MSQLIRLDPSGHTVLAEWSAADPATAEAAGAALQGELECGYFAVIADPGGRAEQVRELPADADLVILRRPIAGG
jgi:hypothetical protein